MSNLPSHLQGSWRRSSGEQQVDGSSSSPYPPNPPPQQRPSQQSSVAVSDGTGRVAVASSWRLGPAPPYSTHAVVLHSSQQGTYGHRPRAPPSQSPRPARCAGFSRPASARSSLGSSALGLGAASSAAAVAWPPFAPRGFPARRPSAKSWRPSSNIERGIAVPFTASHSQTAEEAFHYRTYARNATLLQPKPVPAAQCSPDKEYAQWAGGFVEITDSLLAQICPCNIVGKACPFDTLLESCPMIRLCGQLEKWTAHKCPDENFRTIIDAAENIPADYGEHFGAINYYETSDSDSSGGVKLNVSLTSEFESIKEDKNDFQPSYNGKKVSFNDFSYGIRNDCGHIHWEVEINCRFVAWHHFKADVVCKQVLEKGRFCSCGHDLEASRQAARDAVRQHERAAMRCGATEPEGLGKRWVY